MFNITQLPNGHAAIDWQSARGHHVMVYREVGARGPDDQGQVIASRDLPLDATADDVARTVAKLAAPLPEDVLNRMRTDMVDAFDHALHLFHAEGGVLYFTADTMLPALRAAYVPGDWTWPDRVVVNGQNAYSDP